MPNNWDKLNQAQTPDLKTIADFVASPLWDELLGYMQKTYTIQPIIEYSGCSGAPGWNVKFRKSSRGLCTLYPEQGCFTALVVIGNKEKVETELALPTFSAYTQQLYQNTCECMNQRWLMFHVDSPEILNDVKQCIAIRRRK